MRRRALALSTTFLVLAPTGCDGEPPKDPTDVAVGASSAPEPTPPAPGSTASPVPSDAAAPGAACDHGSTGPGACYGEISVVGVGGHAPVRGSLDRQGDRLVLRLDRCTCVTRSPLVTKTDVVELSGENLDASLVGKSVTVHWSQAATPGAEEGGSGSPVLEVEKIEPAR